MLANRADMANALFAQEFLHPEDRQPIFMKKLLDPGQQRHIGGAVIAPDTRAFDWFYL